MRTIRIASALTALLILLLLPLSTICGRHNSASVFAAGEITLQGTGATFPAPLYQKWFAEYNKAHPGVQINYQALGSGAGIKQFQQGLVDFGASDAAMTDDEISKVKSGGVLLLPMTAGSVVLAYNLPGAPNSLKLSREAYVGILLGKITTWNDPAIAKTNPAGLPATKITVVTRSDGSGTTFVFTSHLTAISEAWKGGPGAGKSVNFPVGVAGKGNPGVTALIKQTPGAIGYVEYGYAKQIGLPMAMLENKSGKFVAVSPDSEKAALSNVELPADLRAWISDPAGADAYPIVTYTWILAHKKYSDPKVADTLKSVLNYGLNEGQSFSLELGYIPLPAGVVAEVSKAVGQIS